MISFHTECEERRKQQQTFGDSWYIVNWEKQILQSVRSAVIMNSYKDYVPCGEILKSQFKSIKNPYILRCIKCEDLFMLLETFAYHIEENCKERKELEVKEEDAIGLDQSQEYDDLEENQNYQSYTEKRTQSSCTDDVVVGIQRNISPTSREMV